MWLIILRTRLVYVRMWVRSLASLRGLRIQCCRKLWYRSQKCSDLALLWLWHRSVATALTGPLAWKLPYVMGAALKKEKKNLANTIFWIPYRTLCYDKTTDLTATAEQRLDLGVCSLCSPGVHWLSPYQQRAEFPPKNQFLPPMTQAICF